MTMPLIWPRDGATGQALVSSLRDVLYKASNSLMPGRPPLHDYIVWVNDSVAALQPLVASGDLDRLVRTPTYWTALTMPANAGHAQRMAIDEMLSRRQELQQVVDSLEQFRQRLGAGSATPLVVPDTNVLLEHPDALGDIDWHAELATPVRMLDDIRIVIPLVVIDELDRAKRVKANQSRARLTLKAIYAKADAISTAQWLRPASDERGAVRLDILMEAPTHRRLERADDELVQTARKLGGLLERPVVFVTYDTGAALRAAAAGLQHVRLRHRTDE